MPKVEWDGMKVNLGHVLTMGTMLVTLATLLTAISVAYGSMRAELGEVNRWRIEAASRLDRLHVSDEAMRARMADNEREMVRVITRLETRLDALVAETARIARFAERQQP